MPINLTKSHVAGKACFEMTLSSYVGMASSLEVQQMYMQDSTHSWMYDGFSENECIMRKGGTDLTNPAGGGYFYANSAGFLEIYLADIDGSHWLAYRSENQILRTTRRKLFTIQYTKLTNIVTLLVDSLPEPLVLLTSDPSFHTDPMNFSGINDAIPDGISWGRGTSPGFSDSLGTLYYNAYKSAAMTQGEVNSAYQVWQDTRTPATQGKVMFSSDRLGNGYDIWHMNPDGTDPLLLKAGGGDSLNPKYSKSPSTDLDYIYQEGYQQVIYDNPTNGFTPYVNPCLDGSFSANSDIIYAIHKNASRSGGFLYPSTTGNMYYPLTYAPYGNGAHGNIFSLDAHPTANNKVAVVFFYVADSVFSIAEIPINFGSPSGTPVSVLFQLPYTQDFSDTALEPSIFGIKYSKAGNQIGFNAYMDPGYTSLHGYTLDTTGSNLVDLGAGIEFVSFSPDDTSVLLKKTVNKLVGGVPTDVSQLFTRNLTTNAEINISNNNWNDRDGDWKP
jgi:hypothetical protein